MIRESIRSRPAPLPFARGVVFTEAKEPRHERNPARRFSLEDLHEGIQAYVHSYYLNATDPPVLIDPRVPKQGIEWFAAHGAPQHIYLTNRHHYRHSDRFAARHGTKVWCHKDGLHEFTHGEKVRGFSHGKALPGGVLALKIAAFCPEETALYVPVNGGILSVGTRSCAPGGSWVSCRMNTWATTLKASSAACGRFFSSTCANANSTTCYSPTAPPGLAAPKTVSGSFWKPLNGSACGRHAPSPAIGGAVCPVTQTYPPDKRFPLAATQSPKAAAAIGRAMK